MEGVGVLRDTGVGTDFGTLLLWELLALGSTLVVGGVSAGTGSILGVALGGLTGGGMGDGHRGGGIISISGSWLFSQLLPKPEIWERTVSLGRPPDTCGEAMAHQTHRSELVHVVIDMVKDTAKSSLGACSSQLLSASQM